MRAIRQSGELGRMGHSSMRRLNGALLLELVRARKSVSRAELARLSGLTKPTVSSQVTDLLRRGLIVEDGAGEPDERGGKPSKLLRFDPTSGNLIGAEISGAEVRVRLADLDGTVLDRKDAPIRPERGAGHILDTLTGAMKDVLAQGRGRKSRLRAVAVAAPGRVDTNTGTVLEAGNVFHWRDVGVRDPIARIFRVPVLVENDVNLAALGEMRYGVGRGVSNFVLIRLTTGVGAGLVLGGQLYRGNHWAAGEIGHMVLDREMGAGVPDERGHLESAVGSDRLRERVLRARSNAALAAALSGSGDSPGDLAAALRGDPAAAEIVNDLATQLSLTAANLAAVLDPELIVLTGEMFDLVTDRIRETVNRVIPWPVGIERSALGEDAAWMGAIAAARGMAHNLLCGIDRGGF